MGISTSVQPWLAEVGAREASMLCARTHVDAETSTDADVIVATVSRDVFFGVPVRTRAGNEIPDGSVLTTYDQVDGYYRDRAGAYVVLASAQLKTVATDWYLFNESGATLRGTGMIGDLDATGREFVVNSAVIFPTAPDGIRGEICVTRSPFADIVGDTVEAPPPLPDARPHLPSRELVHTALHDRFLDAIVAGDDAARREVLRDQHTMAVRLDRLDGSRPVFVAESGDDADAAMSELFADALDLTIATRITTDWYVFAEYLVNLPTGVRRLAITHPVEDGRFIGAFGYGREER